MSSTRRTFLLASAAAAVTSTARAASPLETINIACLGTGGRCRHLMKSLAKMKNVRLAAVCDVWDYALAEAKRAAGEGAFASKDYKEVLGRKGIDAVLIGSPDHWHVPMTVAAIEAGKHVYVEKPLTHSLEEGKAILAASKGKKLALQVGTQQRSMTHLIEAKKLVDAGKLGKVLKVRMSWNRNADRAGRFREKVDPKSVNWSAFLGTAKKQPFDAYRMRQWRWFWDFGGGLFTDLMVHWVDVAHWFLKLEAPEKAISVGHHFATKGLWETPDTVQTILVYSGGLQVHFEGTFSNARAGAMIEFMGTAATLYCDRGRFELTPERGLGKPSQLVLGTGPKGRDFYDKPDGEALHLENWLNAARTGKEVSAPISAGVSAAAAAQLANKALRGTGVATL